MSPMMTTSPRESGGSWARAAFSAVIALRTFGVTLPADRVQRVVERRQRLVVDRVPLQPLVEDRDIDRVREAVAERLAVGDDLAGTLEGLDGRRVLRIAALRPPPARRAGRARRAARRAVPPPSTTRSAGPRRAGGPSVAPRARHQPVVARQEGRRDVERCLRRPHVREPRQRRVEGLGPPLDRRRAAASPAAIAVSTVSVSPATVAASAPRAWAPRSSTSSDRAPQLGLGGVEGGRRARHRPCRRVAPARRGRSPGRWPRRSRRRRAR